MSTGAGGQEGFHAPEQVGDAETVGKQIFQPETGSLLATQQAQELGLAGQSVELRLSFVGSARLPFRSQSQFYFDVVRRAGTSQR